MTGKCILIGIAGRKGAGKDTVGKYLHDSYGFSSVAFADPIKRALAAMFNVHISVFTDPELKEVASVELLGYTPRYLMQTLGTSWGRDTISPELWIKLLQRRVYTLLAQGVTRVVVTDVRMDNEALAIRALGGCIWEVNRPTGIPYVAGDTHRTEAGIDGELVDWVLTNDRSKEDLYSDVDVLVSCPE